MCSHGTTVEHMLIRDRIFRVPVLGLMDKTNGETF